MARTFSFEHRWTLAAPSAVVYEALRDIERYPLWWPQVTGLERLDEDSGTAVVRSLLPYSLHVVLSRAVEDPGTGTLRVGIGGDLDGFAQWEVGEAEDGTTTATYTQVVELEPGWMSRLAALPGAGRLVAAAMSANHGWMMRRGETGLRAHLSRRTP